MAKLSARHRIFVKEYLVDKNGARAARVAGWSAKSARQIASELLTKPNVLEEVEKGLKAQEDKADISAERTIKRIADIAYHKKFAKHSDILKACELLGKHFKLFNEQFLTAPSSTTVHITLPSNGREVKKDVGSEG